DAAGKFFRSVAAQGPRKGNGTRQGHYILTASGKLLGYNNNRSLERRKSFIKSSLEKWHALPESERKPSTGKVAPLVAGNLDKKYHANPPTDGIILVASARILKTGTNGQLETCSADDIEHGWGYMAAMDRMWIRKEEWQSIIKAAGSTGEVPKRLAYRLLRYHLMDFTRGEPAVWKREEVRRFTLKIIPSKKSGHYTLEGSALITTAPDPAKAKRGFEINLLGKIETSPSGKPVRFDLVALGQHWGDGPYTKGSRPGRTPLGIAFRIGNPENPIDLIRPQGSHWLQGYWEAEKH
ncbi:MAG: hypothetical protein GY899_10280, partial [Verrucomicrobiaceae bacterium]|nr:hypothetical protein [Verrucomicrobiaceae bacterium]